MRGLPLATLNGGRAEPAAVAVVFLAFAAVVLPAITSTESITFSAAGTELNLRVLVYFSVAAVASLFALVVLARIGPWPNWLRSMLAMLAWLLLTAFIGRQSPVEWVPTIVRFMLYFGAATVCYWFGRSVADQRTVGRVARLLPLVVLAGAAIPAIAGLLEFVRGTAPLLNGAPRISGSMPMHPVAFSLVLTVSAIATMGPAFLLGRKLGGVLRWLAIAALVALVFLTFTRLSIVLLVVSAVMVAVLLPATRRVRMTRAVGAVVVGAAVVLLAQPTFEARFTYPVPLSQAISPRAQSPAPISSRQPDRSPAPTSSRQPDRSPALGTGSGSGGLDVHVDGSIAYRILLTERGLKYVIQSPLVGHGPGSFDRLFEADSGRARVAAHNDFMSMAVEAGIPGLALYLLTLASIVVALWRRRVSGTPETDSLVVTALVSLIAINIGAAIHNPTYFVEIQLLIWILVGTALGLGERARSTRVDGARDAA